MKRCKEMETIVTEEKAKRARERRCFWTWPFGHCYHETRGVSKCCECGKVEITNRYLAFAPKGAGEEGAPPVDWRERVEPGPGRAARDGGAR